MICAGQPAKTYVADTSLIVTPRSPFLADMSSPDLSTVLLPVHRPNHWVFAVASKSRTTVLLFDSLPSAEGTKAHTQIVSTYLKDIGAAISGSGTDTWFNKFTSRAFSLSACPRQTNVHDCGIAVLVSALHVVTGSHLPAETSYGLWRDVFCSLLLDPPQRNPRLFTRWSKVNLTNVSLRYDETQLRNAHHQEVSRLIAQMRYMCELLSTLRSQADVESPSSEIGKARAFLAQRKEAIKEAFTSLRPFTRPTEMGAIQEVAEAENARLESVVQSALDLVRRLDRVIADMQRMIDDLDAEVRA
jgi:hypothetical protein